MKQGPSRIFAPTLCADPACGRIARAGGIYCGRCGGSVVDEVCADGADAELGVVLLRERLQPKRQQKYVTRRLERQRPAPCLVCGHDSVPGRLYCSPHCRRQGHTIELDGVTGTVLEHAKRRGLAPSTVYRRLQLGRTPLEALTEPIDEVMRGRRLGLGCG